MPNESIDRCFIDTNIWLYAFVVNENNREQERKGQIARELIRKSTPVISTQVINEVCVNLLKQAKFSEEEISRLIRAFYDKYPVVGMRKDIMLSASYLRGRYSLSYWDSLIVAAGLRAGVNILYSEDMQDGLIVEGRLEIRNPFLSK